MIFIMFRGGCDLLLFKKEFDKEAPFENIDKYLYMPRIDPKRIIMDHGHFTKIDKYEGVNLFYCADHHATNRVKGYGARTLLKLWEELGANEIKICEHYEEKAIHGQVVNATEIENASPTKHTGLRYRDKKNFEGDPEEKKRYCIRQAKKLKAKDALAKGRAWLKLIKDAKVSQLVQGCYVAGRVKETPTEQVGTKRKVTGNWKALKRDMEEQIKKQRTYIAELQKKFNGMTQGDATASAELTKQNEELANENNELQEEIDELNKKVETATQKHTLAHTQLTSLHSIIRDLKDEKSKLQSDLQKKTEEWMQVTIDCKLAQGELKGIKTNLTRSGSPGSLSHPPSASESAI